MQRSQLQVVAAIVEREGRFLVGKRSPHKQSAPGYWCPISGCVEAGESQAEAVTRELREESGLAAVALEKVAQCDTRDGTALIHWWLVALLDDAPARLANDEHSELRWVTIEELRRLDPVFEEDLEIFTRVAGRKPR